MKKAVFYGVEWEELENVCDYIRSRGYKLQDEEDSSITIYKDKKVVGEIFKIGGLVFSHIPNIHLESADSDLEKILEEFRGRDSNPSDLPRSSNAGA